MRKKIVKKIAKKINKIIKKAMDKRLTKIINSKEEEIETLTAELDYVNEKADKYRNKAIVLKRELENLKADEKITTVPTKNSRR